MSFQAPLLLALLGLVPFAAAAYVLAQRRRRRFAVRYTNVAVLAGVSAGRSWTRHLPALLALLALAAAFLAAIGRATTAATVAVGIGIVALGLGVWRGSRGAPRQHYRRRPMTRADWLLVAAVALAPVALSVISAAGNDTLAWFASPLRWPRFDPLVGIALLPLLAPLVRRPVAAPVGVDGDRSRVPADLGVAT